jgi:hypothetical protein
MVTREAAIPEYQSLRGEMDAADSRNYTIMGLAGAAIGAISTAAISAKALPVGVLMCGVSYVVTFVTYKLLQGNRSRIWRISTYILTFLEPELDGVGWEARLDAQRRLKPLSSSIISNEGRVTKVMAWTALGTILACFVSTTTTSPKVPQVEFGRT